MSCCESRIHLLRQIWTSSGVLISMAAQAMSLNYISALPELREPNSEGDSHDTSWTASSSIMAFMLGLLISSILMEVLGRKMAYLILTLPGAVGLLLTTSSSVPFIVAGRILAEVTFGGTIMLGAVVIGECTSPGNRGMFLNLKTAAVALGSTISHILNNYHYLPDHTRTITWIIFIPQIISFLIICTWLESPTWLALKGKVEMSESNFYSLRGVNHKSKAEFEEMIRVQTARTSKAKKPYKMLRIITKRSFMRPVFIMFMGSLLLEMSGRHIFPTYSSDIILEMGGSKSNYNLWIGIIITVCAALSSLLIKFMKARTLLFTTGAASLLVVLIANTYLFLSSNKIVSNDNPWVPTSMFTVYFILANLGCIPIPMALLGEIFPSTHRGSGLLVTGVLSCLCRIATLKSFPYLIVSIKLYGTFALTAMIKTLLLMVLFVVLPETKNKTLQQIEDSIEYGKTDDTKSLPDYSERDKMLK